MNIAYYKYIESFTIICGLL